MLQRKILDILRYLDRSFRKNCIQKWWSNQKILKVFSRNRTIRDFIFQIWTRTSMQAKVDFKLFMSHIHMYNFSYSYGMVMCMSIGIRSAPNRVYASYITALTVNYCFQFAHFITRPWPVHTYWYTHEIKRLIFIF